MNRKPADMSPDPRELNRDAIRESLIARMYALGLSPAQVAELSGHRNPEHAVRYLSRRARMTTFDAQSIARFLGMTLREE